MVNGERAALSPDETELLASALLGEGLPAEAEDFSILAKPTPTSETSRSSYLREAQAMAPGHAAVLIGLYRFYFTKAGWREALEIANRCLEKAARENRLAAIGDARSARTRFLIAMTKCCRVFFSSR